MTAILDIIDGALLRRHKGTIAEVTRVAIVKTAAPATEDAALLQALQDPAMPAANAEHGQYPGLFLVDQQVRALGPTLFHVDLLYQRPEGGGFDPPPNFPLRIAGGASVQQIETMVDRFGNPITVTHNGVLQGGVIHPEVAVEYLRLGETAQSADPTIIHRTWVNVVNSGPFFFDVAANPREWRITDINFELEDPDTLPYPTWQFGYELHKRPVVVFGVVGTHDPQVYYKDPDTGQPPNGLVAGVGYKTIQWHQAMNFTALFG
jgi:hypothetical protein